MKRNDLESIKRIVEEGKSICSKSMANGDTMDILKSFIILESKVNYYLNNYDALNSHRMGDVGD